MFKIFRNPFTYKYVQGYLDGYADAETEFLENADYAITAYNNGYKDGQEDNNDAVVTPVSEEKMSTNDENQEMSANEDKNGGM